MRKLNRTQQPFPANHGSSHGNDGWNQFRKNYGAQIWNELIQMQGVRCAYCERPIADKNNRHIDHFVPRDRDPKKTFQWDNLFGSCNTSNTCGDHKKNRPPQNALKPDHDDPIDFLVIVPDGTIAPRENIPQPDTQRAEYTIAYFNLNHADLKNARKNTYTRHKKAIEELQYDPESIAAYITNELNRPKNPFLSTVEAALT